MPSRREALGDPQSTPKCELRHALTVESTAESVRDPP